MSKTRKLPLFVALIAALALSFCLVGCDNEEKVELELFAANSLSNAMDEATAEYTKQHPNVTFKDPQYEASGTLAQKIIAGAKPDIFISANQKNMTLLEDDDFISPEAASNLFKNDLVIVAAENSDIDEITLEEAASGKYTIALGDDNVPAGTYAKQALSHVGCYTSNTGSDGEITGPIVGKVTEADKVGSVCAYAESGDVDLGFVYSSDVMRYGGVKVVCEVPLGAYDTIAYPAAVTLVSEHDKEAQDFLEWCRTDKIASQIWQKWGFELA